jgi:murein DD-endopeptidase MepM/ murein hydrolase activator NlpD
MTSPARFLWLKRSALITTVALLILTAWPTVQAAAPHDWQEELQATPSVPSIANQPVEFGYKGLAIGPRVEAPPASPGDAPQKLVFPAADPPPLPDWRPPLYDVPWALGPHDHFYFVRPIAINKAAWLVDYYRYGDYYPDTEIIHTGMDITADLGTPILAAAEGKVVWAGEGLAITSTGEDPYGIAVVILHDFGVDQRKIQTVYAHMARADVKVGQRVKAGDQLGIVGMTGFTTGPHLHFEVRIEEGDFFVTRNPELWLVPAQGWGVLAARLMKKDGTPFHKLEVVVRSLEDGRMTKVRTYAPTSVHGDDYYNENLVLSDLPAGTYQVSFRYFWISESIDVTILPGAVTYFTFRNTLGFSFDPPSITEKTEPFNPAPID